MTLRPDDDLHPSTDTDTATATGPSPDEPVQVDEDPELEANRTDVEGSPTGHS